MTADELWSLFYQRDTVLIVFLLEPLVVLGLYASIRWGEAERFFRDHPEMARRFKHWQRTKQPEVDPLECPTHHIKVLPRKSCPVSGCAWRPKR